MKRFQRRVGILLLLALFCALGQVSAQDNNTITVLGSSQVTPILSAFKDASKANADLNITVSGTRTGFDSLCQDKTDVVAASSAITADESTKCVNNNVQYAELLIAHNILAFITPPDAAYAQCLTTDNLDAIFAPSAQGKITNWNQIAAENANTPLTVIAPKSDQATFNVLDAFIAGDGIRGDAQTEGSDTDVATLVSKTPGSIGVVSLPVAAANASSVKVIQINTNTTTGCAAPTAENVEGRMYAAAADSFLYVNRASLTKPGLQDLLNFALGDQAPGIIEGLGLTPPSAMVYQTNRDVLSGKGSSHPFTEATTSFSIPADVSGQVTIGGAANALDYLNSLKTSLSGQYQSLTFDIKTEGEVVGMRRLCNGEIDIAAINAQPTSDEAQNCSANNILTLNIDLGYQATVLVANSSDTFLACLKPDQIKTALGAPSGDAIKNWNQVDKTFSDEAITLFNPATGNTFTDLLMTKAAGTDYPLRTDGNSNDDALYRAAATANVPGGITYMSWADYQKVLAKNQQRIQLVSISNGGKCVAPSDATIKDGSYLISRDTQLLVNKASLTKVQVQSFLWFLASDENYSALQTAGFVGLSFGDLPGLRDTLQKAYVDAAIAAAAAAEATPEATTEATAEATNGATSAAATVEATSAPTAAVTSQPTSAATAEVTSQATAEATAGG